MYPLFPPVPGMRTAADPFAGRLLSLLPPNTPEFATLPPKFSASSFDNDDIAEGLKVLFQGDVLPHKRILTHCLASVAYHCPWFRDVIARHPQHPFTRIPILKHPDLLDRLQTLLFRDPPDGVRHTGVPPHIFQNIELKLIEASCQQLKEQSKRIVKLLRDTIRQARDTKSDSCATATDMVGLILHHCNSCQTVALGILHRRLYQSEL